MQNLAIKTVEEEKAEIHTVNVVINLLSEIESARLQINKEGVNTAHVEMIEAKNDDELPVLEIIVATNKKTKAERELFTLTPERLETAKAFIHQFVTVSPSSSAKEGTLLGVKH